MSKHSHGSLLITWRHGEFKGRSESHVARLQLPKILEVILVSNNQTKVERIMSAVNQWGPEYTAALRLRFIPASYPPEFKWMEKLFGPCGLLRLFMPQVLPVDLKRVLYVDTDIIFFRDVRRLWTWMVKQDQQNSSLTFISARDPFKFKTWIRSSRSLLQLPDNIDPSYNTGLVYMDLEKWRLWYNEWLAWLNSMRKFENEMITKMWLIPDQMLFNLYLKTVQIPLHKEFPCAWNYAYYVITHLGGNCSSENTQRIFAFHGSSGAFFKKPIAIAIFKHFKETELNSKFSIKKFKTSLRKKIKKAMLKCRSCKSYERKLLPLVMRSVQKLV